MLSLIIFIQVFIYIFLLGVFLIYGLSLWNKVKFPFSWRKVWGLLFLYISIQNYISIIISFVN